LFKYSLKPFGRGMEQPGSHNPKVVSSNLAPATNSSYMRIKTLYRLG